MRLALRFPLPALAAVIMVAGLLPARLAAQAGTVEAMASILAAEDARRFDAAALHQGLNFADTVVRARSALAVGRIGDLRGTALLLPLLDDESSNVRPAAAFALGLLRDTAAIDPLVRRLTVPPGTDLVTAQEAITALGRIGGPRAADFFAGALTGRNSIAVENPHAATEWVVFESWRLGPDAPVNELVPFMTDTAAGVRWRAVHAVGRLRQAARPSGARMAATLRDRLALARALAARALTPAFVDSAGLSREATADLLAGALNDPDPGVRINALRTLGLYRVPASAGRVVPLVQDQHTQVSLQAIATLGDIGGPDAVATLAGVANSDRPYGFRREALLGIARADTAALRTALVRFERSTDWRERAAAAEAAATAYGPGARTWLQDSDGRVVAAALQSWTARSDVPDPLLADAARPLLTHADVMVRASAAAALARAPSSGDVAALGAMYGRTGNDSTPDASIAALDALAAIARSSPEARATVDAEFLRKVAKPRDYVVTLWAEDNWPDAAARWGPAYPVATGRSAADYREIARRFYTGTDRLPKVVIEVDQKGTVEIELLGPDAPITVASFLQLVQRRYFDRLRVHRVVPNFVVQDGDPRGDGNGGPGYAIRDELNRHRYESTMIGMALSGMDTGGSQWFINLSPQPHLDGAYTIFGRVTAGQGTLQRIVPGDQIRTIRR